MTNRGFYKIDERDLYDRFENFQGGDFGRKGFAFECIVGNLFSAKNYRIETGYDGEKWYWNKYNGRQRGDKGVDLLVEKDGIKTIIQCKHYDINTVVGAEEIRELLGTCKKLHNAKRLFITTSSFSSDACNEYRNAVNSGVDIELWDWNKLRLQIEEHLLDS